MKTIACIVGFALTLFASTAPSCICTTKPPPEKALEEASVVFLGTVTEIGPVSGDGKVEFSMKPVTFRVIETWKGINMASHIVYTPDTSGACGYPFVQGGTYLVYARKMFSWTLATSICTRTCDQSHAAEDLKFLGSGQKPKAN